MCVTRSPGEWLALPALVWSQRTPLYPVPHYVPSTPCSYNSVYSVQPPRLFFAVQGTDSKLGLGHGGLRCPQDSHVETPSRMFHRLVWCITTGGRLGEINVCLLVT